MCLASSDTWEMLSVIRRHPAGPRGADSPWLLPISPELHLPGLFPIFFSMLYSLIILGLKK